MSSKYGRPKTPIDDYLDDIRRVADKLGHPPRSWEYQEHGEYSGATRPDYFDGYGWFDRIEAAGLDPESVPDERRIPTEELLLDLQAGAEFLGRPPTISEINSFGEYSVNPYRRRFGSWPDALEAAGLEVPPHRDFRESGDE